MKTILQLARRRNSVLFVLFGFFCSYSQNMNAQVTITRPSLAITTCTFPSSPNALGNIVITETAKGDFSVQANKTLILSAPANFQFQSSTGTVTDNGQNVTVTGFSITNASITITFTASNTNKFDVITISGVKVQALNAATASSNITRTGGNGLITGDVAGTIHGSVGSTDLNTTPVANAGTAISLCGNATQATPTGAVSVNITAGASASGYSSIGWTSSGTGTFTSANSLSSATYTPSAADKTAGSVQLTLTAFAACTTATSVKTLTLGKTIQNNTIVLVSVCKSGTNAQVVISQGATALSGGDGTFTYSWEFSSPGNSSYVVIPGETGPSLSVLQGSNNGFYRRTVYSGGCSIVSNNIHVNANNVIGATAFTITGGGAYCASSATGIPVGLSGSINGLPEFIATYKLLRNGSYTGDSFVGNGAAFNFPNQTIAGTYTIDATVSVVSGSSCSAQTITGSVTVSVDAVASTSVAGANQSLCESVVTNLAGNIPLTGTGNWTLISGTGTVTNSLNPTSGVTGLGLGNNVFRWTITNGTCSNFSDITITVSKKSANPVSASASSPSICQGSSSTLTLNGGGGGTGETIVWYSGSCGGTLIGTGNNLSVNPLTSTTYYGRYENGVPCNYNSLCASVTVTVTSTGTWLGYTSDWNDPANWCGGIPTSTTNVLVPAGALNNPVIVNAIAKANNLSIAVGAVVTIDGNTLQLSGALSSAGALNAINGSVDLNGNTGPQMIAGSMFTVNKIANLKISNSFGVSFSGINDTVKISGVLSFGASNSTLNTNNNLTLLSSAAGTASLADMTANGLYSNNHIIGNATVERYIPNHFKAWQFLSVPTKGQTINAAWQEGNTTLANNRPGYGTIITGHVAGATGLGFDIYTPAGSTMKVFNAATQGWDAVSSTSMPIANSQGYQVFVRGDRSVNAYNQPATETILRTTGKLYTTDADAPGVVHATNGKFQSVGNPYASAIDFSKITKTGGIQDIFYVWDPKLTSSSNSAYGLGGYQTFIGPGPNYTVIPGGGSYTTGNVRVESGSAFLIYAAGSDGDLAFTESCKTTGSNLVTRSSAGGKLLRTNLSVIAGGQNILLTGTLSQYDATYANTIDHLDARKIGNSTGEGMAILRNGNILVAERRSTILNTDTIFYGMTQLRKQQYQFEFIAENLAQPGLTAFLEDNYLHSSVPVQLEATTIVTFTVDDNAASGAADRFRIVFNQQQIVLPVKFTRISANRSSKTTIDIVWNIENETDMVLYETERSGNGANFEKIAAINPKLNNGGGSSYQYVDRSPLSADNFYRIKGVSLSGLVQYSAIVKVDENNDDEYLSVYPNPVVNREMNFSFTNQPVGTYKLALINKLGQSVYNQKLVLSDRNSTMKISLPSSVVHGMYTLRVQSQDGKVSSQSLLVD
ncbi:MAG: T9SS type A sorting domain-containing protein [Ferruginibacter sp.]